MFRISRMQEVMKGLPRDEFDRLVRTSGSDKHSKGFGSWRHLVAMVYGQLAGASSLRELERGFNSHRTHHYHLGCSAVRRSTLADANARRSMAIFDTVVQALTARVHRTARRDVRELLVAIDSTSITAKGRGFDDWSMARRTHHTQGLKLHIGLAVTHQVPISQSITAPTVNDIEEAIKLPLEAGTIYVFDKGYCSYNWWHQIEQAGARFVTRFKYNARLTGVDARPIPPADQQIIVRDEIVRFALRTPSGGRHNQYHKPLRRVVVARPDHHCPLVLATNDLDSPAVTIAQHYKDRWQVELFFKWIKQHLKIKQFFGRSENAVRIQILTALIAYLLVALYRKSHGLKQSLWALLGELRATLFQRPDIEAHWYEKRKREREEFAYRQPGFFA